MVQRAEDLVQLTAFVVGDEEYVVDIMRVLEIIRPVAITPVRRGPRHVEGVINLRGAVIPVVDMRKRLGLGSRPSPHRKIIIVGVESRTIGLVVDRVSEVVRVPRSAIRAAEGLLGGRRAPLFLGVCSYHDRDLILLDVKSLLGMKDENMGAEGAAKAGGEEP